MAGRTAKPKPTKALEQRLSDAEQAEALARSEAQR
jgi:hypothetical protein